MRIFNEAEAVQDPKAPEPTEETVVKAHTRKPKRTVDELTKGLPIEKIILDLTEEEQVCGTCVADVMIQKYVDGIPLARQEKIWKRDGIALTRAKNPNRSPAERVRFGKEEQRNERAFALARKRGIWSF